MNIHFRREGKWIEITLFVLWHNMGGAPAIQAGLTLLIWLDEKVLPFAPSLAARSGTISVGMDGFDIKLS